MSGSKKSSGRVKAEISKYGKSIKPPRHLERILVIPDSHFRHVDYKAWNLMLRAAEYLEPAHTIQLGDLMDCEAVSFHEKNPAERVTLDDDVGATNDALDQLDAFGNKRYVTLGNHENRVPRFIAQKCPELYGLVDVPKLLRLKERGWNVTSYMDYLKIGSVHFTHEEGNCGPQAHIKARDTFEGCVVIGHTHRMATHYSSNVQGTCKVGMMMGWLGDAEKISYQHRAKLRHWTLGFGSGTMEPDGTIHLVQHPIIDYKVCVDGKVIS